MAVRVDAIAVRGVFVTQCYFVSDDRTGRAFLVDAGAQPRLIARAADDLGLTVQAILLTHGHFDHFGAVVALRDEWGAPAFIHRAGPAYLQDTYLNLSASHGTDMTLHDVRTFDDGASFALDGGRGTGNGGDPEYGAHGSREADGPVRLEALHVPGHTGDSCAFYCAQAGVAFVGDTVYEGGPGLTVFPTGDRATISASIRTRLLGLPPRTVLLSGHSRPITVADLARAMS